MNMIKKITAALLLACLLLSIAACGNAADTTADTTPGGANTDGAENTDHVSGSVSDTEEIDMSRVLEVPEVDYDGYEFTFFTGSHVDTCPYLFTVDNDADSIDQAIERRNAQIEETYGIVITEYREIIEDAVGNGATFRALEKAWNSGDTTYDAAVGSPYDCCALAQGGMLVDLRNYGHINLDKAWWDQPANDAFTIYGRTFITTGDINYIDDNFTYAIAFNKDMIAVFDLDDPYQLVRDGVWTYDKLYEMSRAATKLDNVEGYSANDIYGFLGYCDTTWMSFSSIGAHIAKINDDGELELTMSSERNFDLIREWTEFGQSEAFVNWQTEDAATKVGWKKIFSSDQALFFGATVDGIYKLRDTDLDYGYLPWPKYDENQEGYHSGMAPNHISLFCIPDVGDDAHVERNSILIEAMSAGSDIIMEGFYKKNLEGKSVRDEESYETLEIIFADKVFDLGYYYGVGQLRLSMLFRFRDGLTTMASIYAEREISAKFEIADINKLYKKYE